MRFKQLYSSSSGNLYTVTASNGERLLIECGVVWPKIQKALNYNLDGIVGCLVSHDHKDHCKAIEDVMRAGIDVYASMGTLEACGVLDNRRTNILDADQGSYVGGSEFLVYSYAVNHDATEPLMFVIRHGNIRCNDLKFMLFATDTSHIKQRFTSPFSIIAIECSYDKDVLAKRVKEKDINEVLAKRLLTSHMERSEAMRYIEKFCALTKCQEIHLLHMSGDNLNKRQTRKEFEERFLIDTKIV